MEENFRGLNVDVTRLANAIEHYLEKEGFETNIETTPEWQRVQAKKTGMLRLAAGAQRCIEVNIRGIPSAFEVEMTTGEWGKNLAASAVVGALTFGLGWVGAGISAVAYRKLEEKIFDYIQWQVDELRGTAGETKPTSAPQPTMVPVPNLVSALPPCPACGKRIRSEFKMCPYCGFNLQSLQVKCNSCGSPVDPSWNVCANCGVTIAWATAR